MWSNGWTRFFQTLALVFRFIVPEISNIVLRLNITAVLFSLLRQIKSSTHSPILNNINKLNVPEIHSEVSQSEVIIKFQVTFLKVNTHSLHCMYLLYSLYPETNWWSVISLICKVALKLAPRKKKNADRPVDWWKCSNANHNHLVRSFTSSATTGHKSGWVISTWKTLAIAEQ